jgi:hypothetical protein
VSGEKPPRVSLADALEEVRWDYDPTRRLASPLLPTARYFADFPWDGQEEAEEKNPD